MSKRRKNDFYPTPSSATEELLKHIDVNGKDVFEPCSGKGDISNILKAHGAIVETNDIDLSMEADSHEDAANPESDLFSEYDDWVITNPPFNQAFPIVKQGVEKCKHGAAFLLRISFLEPTFERGPWLAANPPNKIIVLPRISFTGDGKTDSVTCAWLIWDKSGDSWVKVAPKNVASK